MINSTLSPVDTIATHHYQEWQSSAVSETIIRRNVKSIYDSRELDKTLYRNTNNRRKHSDHLVPAWMVSGVDPLTDENTLEGVQVKPDTPTAGRNGKLQKYLGASGVNSTPLFLDTGTEGYWQAVRDDKSIPIIISEGAKKAGAGLSLGIPTISLPGVSTCRKYGRLHYWLEAFTGYGRVFYLCFDADIVEKRPVQNALTSLARDLAATGSKVMVITLPSLDLKGMDDFIAAKGEAEFRKLMEQASTIEEWTNDLTEKRKSEEFDFDDEQKKSRLYRAYKIIKQGWGEAIRFNRLKKCVELHDAKLNLDLLVLYIALEFDLDISKDHAHSIITAISQSNAYSPVCEYLDSLATRYPNPDLTILDNLALKYFGTDDPLHNTYIKKLLVGAVARARRPGCKFDDLCILVGEQGLRKSTFWRELFGTDWFTDELSDSSEKDELMKLHQFWGLEISEVEHIYKRKDVGSLKKFLSSSIDAFRYPYDRETKEHPRACVLVGSSNETELLHDPTGNRRFWIVPVNKHIPIEELIKDRDAIWAAANHLYTTGYTWYLSYAEYAQQSEANKEYQTTDPWEEVILPFVKNKEGITTYEILLNALQIEPGRQDKLAERRVSSILRQNGWEQRRKWVNGHALRAWFCKKFGKISGSSGSSGSTQSQQGFNHDPDSFPHLDHLDQCETATNQTFTSTQNTDVLQTSFSEKFGKISGSSGSSGSTQSQQGFNHDPDSYPHLDHLDQCETAKNQTSVPTPNTDPDDPDTKKHLDHPEPLHSKVDPDDPDDPDKISNFSNLTTQHLHQCETAKNQTSVPTPNTDPDDPDTKKHLDHPEPLHSKVDPDDPDDPDKISNFDELSNDTSTQGQGFSVSQVRSKISSAIGYVKATATKTSATTYDIQLLLPNGVEKLITRKASTDEQATSQIHRAVGAWKSSLTFSVRQMVADEYVWISGCKCISIPCAHTHNMWYRFRTPAGDDIQVRGDFEFRLEEK